MSEVKISIPPQKTAKVVALRNRFFYMMYRHATLVFLASLISAIVSVAFLIFFIRQPIPPQYVPVNEEGRYIPLIPLNERNKTDAEIQRFTLSALKKIYQYDYVNFPDQIQEGASYFTQKGWNDYLEAFTDSRVLLAVKENNWVVTFQPKGLPVIREAQLRDGVFSWAVEMDVALGFVGKTGSQMNGTVSVIINRISVIDNPSGIGINRLIFVEKKNGN